MSLSALKRCWLSSILVVVGCQTNNGPSVPERDATINSQIDASSIMDFATTETAPDHSITDEDLTICGDGTMDGLEQCDDGNTNNGDGCDNNCTQTACGNGIVTDTEVCDDGNTTNGDGCDNNCTQTACGNGIVTDTEVCDDGNTTNGDGCDNNCTQTACGNGIVTDTEVCDDGNTTNGDGCDNNCTQTACGNGIVTDTEVCDDGNTNNGDGCDNNCTQTACGNGIVTDTEVCDDGNTTNGDGCDNNCTQTACGNGIVTDTEVCDDGNTTNGDGCDNNCTQTACGNGIVTDTEVCDDGNTTNGDGCDNNCTQTACGNGILTDTEVCDDGNTTNGDGCDNNCTQTACGNGIVTDTEVCDDGNTNNGDGCDNNCTQTACGNGIVTNTEVCDDGNTTNGDGCDNNCTQTACGNGIVTNSEVCDDGNTTNGDGCDNNCTQTACGNGIVTNSEVCDDGNTTNGDGCDNNCTQTACGNGIVTNSEVCDDGNTTNGDGCDNNCTQTACGNGIVTNSEVCDDGNTTNGDGCDNNCTQTACGNGIVTNTEVCDDGNTTNGDGCDNNCTQTACGNGIVTDTEVCDDGNTNNGDGCDNNCTQTACGNGIVTNTEVCDDGNLDDFDDCRLDCRPNFLPKIETIELSPSEVVFSGETITCSAQVSDQNGDTPALSYQWTVNDEIVGTDASVVADFEPNTLLTCTALAADRYGQGEPKTVTIGIKNRCGDGYKSETEDCDDGNANPNDGCLNSCKIATCGDGVLHIGVEDCDAGQTNAGCDSNCKISPRFECTGTQPSVCTNHCGNSNIDADEECERSVDGEDICSEMCTFTHRCGDGILDETEDCDDGNLWSHDGCSSTCTGESECTQYGAKDHSLALSATRNSVVAIQNRLYWLRGNRLLERSRPDGTLRQTRMLTGSLGGKDIKQIHAAPNGLILHMTTDTAHGGESLWYLNTARFITDAPILLHRADAISESGNYLRTWTTKTSVYAIGKHSTGETLSQIDFRVFNDHNCPINTDCGRRQITVLGADSNGVWSIANDQSIYLIQQPNGDVGVSTGLFRLDGSVTVVDLALCEAPSCSFTPHQLGEISTIIAHRGAIYLAALAKGFFSRAHRPVASFIQMALEPGDTPWIEKINDQLVFHGAQIHVVNDPFTSTPQRIADHVVHQRIVAIPHGWGVPIPTEDGLSHLHVSQRAHNVCSDPSMRVQNPINSSGNYRTIDALAQANPGYIMAGRFDGTLEGHAAKGVDSWIAKFDMDGQPREQLVVTSAQNGTEHITAINDLPNGRLQIAGTLCKHQGNASPCNLEVFSIAHQKAIEPIELGNTTIQSGVGFVMELMSTNVPIRTMTITPDCEADGDCEVQVITARQTTLGTLVLVKQRGPAIWQRYAHGQSTGTKRIDVGAHFVGVIGLLPRSDDTIQSTQIRSSQDVALHHFDVTMSESSLRVVTVGHWTGTLMTALDERTAPNLRNGLVVETLFRVDETVGFTIENRRLFSVETLNIASSSGVHISDEGDVWVTGYRYAPTEFISKQVDDNIPHGAPRTDTWIARYTEDEGVKIENQLGHPNHDILDLGIIGYNRTHFIATARSSNTDPSKVYVYGNLQNKGSFERVIQPNANQQTRITRPVRLDDDRILVGTYSQHDTQMELRTVRVGDPDDDTMRTVEAAGGHALLMRIEFQEPGRSCAGEPRACASICGDGRLSKNEGCDDGNQVANDGCAADCTVEVGFHCANGSCAPICGDGIRVMGETCDDGNLIFGDGCSDTCHIEKGFTCPIEERCTRLPECSAENDNTPCYDTLLDRCEPSGVCSESPLLTTLDVSGLGRCAGDSCSGQKCTPDRAGDVITCGSNVGQCEVGQTVCDGTKWSECTGLIAASDEVCNDLDDDCDGSIDESLGVVECGLGSCKTVLPACNRGIVTICPTPNEEGGDERCNGVDDDCDGKVDESLDVEEQCGVGSCSRTIIRCESGKAQSCVPGVPTVETCNQQDDDCNGVVDDMQPQTCGLGVCAKTIPRCVGGDPVLDCEPLPNAQDESCNNLDDDCDGNIDEDIADIECGVGACKRSVSGCLSGEVPNCEVGDSSVEICNGIDDDCDGTIDNGVFCYDHSCEAEGGVACVNSIESGDNQPPYIHPSSTIVTPDGLQACLNPNPGLGLGGNGPILSGDVGTGNSNTPRTNTFQTCALDLRFGDPDGVMPLTSIEWGDGQSDDPAMYTCQTETSPRVLRFDHRYAAPGDYEVIVRVEDSDGLSAQVAYNLSVTMPQRIQNTPCNGWNCFTTVPGACVVTTPIFYVDENDDCQPLHESTFCDTNVPNSPCPNAACSDVSSSLSIDVFTAPGSADDVQWSWLPESGLNIIEQTDVTSARTCETGINLVGKRLTLPCDTAGHVRATGGGAIRNARVKVGNSRPSLNLVTFPTEVVAGERFTATASASDADGEIVRYRWEVGDRLINSDAASMTTFITTTGRHLVKVSAIDNSGARAVSGFYVDVVDGHDDLYMTTDAPNDLWLADDTTVYTFHLHLPSSQTIEDAEIWLGYRTHDDPQSKKRFGRLRYNFDTDTVSIVMDTADEWCGSERIELAEGAGLEIHETGARRVNFAVRFKSGVLDGSRAVGPIDIAYRARQTDDTYFRASLDNHDGWFNYPHGAYIADLRPKINAMGSIQTTDTAVYFAAVDSGTLVFFHQRLDESVRRIVRENIWTYGDGTFDGSGGHLYQRPGAYDVFLTRDYEEGFSVASQPIRLIINGDSDGDGVLDHEDPDNDNDGICDKVESVFGTCAGGPDALPYNPWQDQDRDGDGIGDAQDRCFGTAIDALGAAPCYADAFPDDPQESMDTDGDGVGDTADTDDDNDGVTDIREAELGLFSTLEDSDGDGIRDGDEVVFLGGDWIELDSDGDGVKNHLDIDSDGDGLMDGYEPFPFLDPDGDGIISILDNDADNDGVEDGLDQTPWAFYEPASVVGFWKDQFPAGYLEFERRHAVADWDGTLTKQPVFPDFFGYPDYDPNGAHVYRDLPSSYSNDLEDDVLPKINEQLEPQGFICREPRQKRTLTSDETRHYYGPYFPIHGYHEHLTYAVRIREIAAQCWSTETKPNKSQSEDNFWHNTAKIRLNSTVDNDIHLQFTLNANYAGTMPYGAGAEINSANDTAYRLPGFEFRVYSTHPNTPDDWTQSAYRDRLRHQGFMVAEKIQGTALNGDAIFQLRIRIPKEVIGDHSHWLMLSPRVEWFEPAEDLVYLTLDPHVEQLKITSLVHQLSGPNAHLVTPIVSATRWDEIKDAIVDTFSNEGQLSLQTLMTQPTGRYTVGQGSTVYQIALVNQLLDPDAIPSVDVGADTAIDGVLVLSDRAEEITPLIDSEINCDNPDTCRWYVYRNGALGPEKFFQGGDLISSNIRMDFTEVGDNGGSEWTSPIEANQAYFTELLSDARAGQRTITSFLDSAAGIQAKMRQLKFQNIDFKPFGTVDGVFEKYDISFKYRGTPNGVPLYELRAVESKLALADGLDTSVKWQGRQAGIHVKQDHLVEFVSTELDADGKPVPPRQFLKHGDVRATGTVKGSSMVEQLVIANRSSDQVRFSQLMKPSVWGAALERVTGVAGVGLAGAGVIIGGGMMMTYNYDEDGFWQGAVLTGQSLAELYSEYKSVQAGQALARASTQAQYATRMANAAKWAKVTVYLGVGAEAALASYYFYKATKTNNPLERRRYVQSFVGSTVNTGIMAIYPVGTISSAIYTISMLTVGVIAGKTGWLDREIVAEVGDLGSLAVNIGLAMRPDTTETWKVNKILEDDVFPWVDFYLNHYQNRGLSPIILDFKD